MLIPFSISIKDKITLSLLLFALLSSSVLELIQVRQLQLYLTGNSNLLHVLIAISLSSGVNLISVLSINFWSARIGTITLEKILASSLWASSVIDRGTKSWTSNFLSVKVTRFSEHYLFGKLSLIQNSFTSLLIFCFALREFATLPDIRMIATLAVLTLAFLLASRALVAKIEPTISNASALNISNLNKIYASNIRYSYKLHLLKRELATIISVDKTMRYYEALLKFIQSSPRKIIEFVVSISLLLFIIVNGYHANIDFSGFAVIFSVLYRLIPSLQSSYSSYILSKSSKSSYVEIKSYLRSLPQHVRPIDSWKVIDLPPAVKLSSIVFIIKPFHKTLDTRQIQYSIDTTISYREWVLIQGPSGSGKSSFISVLAGLSECFPTDASTVVVNSQPSLEIPTYNNEILWHHMEFISQDEEIRSVNINPFEFLTGKINLNQLSYQEKQKLSSILEITISTSLMFDSNNVDAPIYSILPSEGEMQRLKIARALWNEPLCLLMDEPFSGLDHNTEIALVLNLKESFTGTVVMITHTDLPTSLFSQVLSIK